MSWLNNEKVQAAEKAVDESKKKRIPIGPNICTITDVELSKTKKGNDPMIKFETSVGDGHHSMNDYLFFYDKPKNKKEEETKQKKFQRFVRITMSCGVNFPNIPEKIVESDTESQVKWLFSFAKKSLLGKQLQVMVKHETAPYIATGKDGSKTTRRFTKAEPLFYGKVSEDMSGYDRASLTVVIDSVQAATLDKSPKPAVNVQPVQDDSEEGWVE